MPEVQRVTPCKIQLTDKAIDEICDARFRKSFFSNFIERNFLLVTKCMNSCSDKGSHIASCFLYQKEIN